MELHFDSLEAKGAEEFREEGLTGESERTVDLRYVGQGYELNVAAGEGMMEAFHALHRKRFGYADTSRAVEVVTVRVRMSARTEAIDLPVHLVREGDGSQAVVEDSLIHFDGGWLESKAYDRDALRAGDRFVGPALITEYSATTVVPPRCEVSIDTFGNVVIEVQQ